MSRLRALVAAAAASLMLAALASGCGEPERLSDRDAVSLGLAREDLDDALDTEETLRSSPADARKLVVRVRKILAEGSLESDPPDEFGLAALGELYRSVPSIVIIDAKGGVRRLDRPATRAFLRWAETDPIRSVLRPVTGEVKVIERVVEDSGAGPDTEVPPLQRAASGHLTVSRYLRETERDLRPVWPGLARRLHDARTGL